MSNESPLAQGQVDVLVGRLRAHAEAHEYIANADPEQKQWMNDLYDAADVIERALKEVEARAERYHAAIGMDPTGKDESRAALLDYVRGVLAERDALIQTLRDEIDENLRLRELGCALPDENITAMPEHVEQLAITRYRPVPNGMFGYKVVAGDGTRSVFEGTKSECTLIARKLTEAFLDGAHVAGDAREAAGYARGLAVAGRDAERYRWLRDVSVPPHNFYLSVPDEFAGVRYTPTEVDAAIDAAIDALRGEAKP